MIVTNGAKINAVHSVVTKTKMARQKNKAKKFHFTPVVVGKYNYGEKQSCPHELKRRGHQLLDQIFGKDMIAQGRWMANYTSTGHWRNITEFEAKRAIRKLESLLKQRR
ncbi:MAG: hypothetical protein AB7U82_01030 [Blastocatellales bacterium]